jgi:hypothetical protein
MMMLQVLIGAILLCVCFVLYLFVILMNGRTFWAVCGPDIRKYFNFKWFTDVFEWTGK